MNNPPLLPININFLNLNPQPPLPRGPPPDNIANHIKPPPTLLCKREPLRRVPEQRLPCLQRRIRVPVVRLLRASDDRSAFQRARNAERPSAVAVLARERYIAWVADEACLALTC